LLSSVKILLGIADQGDIINTQVT